MTVGLSMTPAWIQSINHGSLWHIGDSVYPVFYALEEETRRHVKNRSAQDYLDAKGLMDAITSSDDILFCWSIASAEYGQEEKTILHSCFKT